MGMPRKRAAADIGLAYASAKSLVDQMIGVGVWESFGEVRARFDATGIKGRTTQAPTIKQQMGARGSDARNEVAKAVRLWRKGNSTYEVGMLLRGVKNSGAGILARSSGYRKITKKRLVRSEWRKSEVDQGYRSAELVNEADMCKKICEDLIGAGYEVSREHMVGDWSKVDVYAQGELYRYAIEVKASARKSRIAGCLGQALISAHGLRAVPVVCVPAVFSGNGIVRDVVEMMDGLLVNEHNIVDVMQKHSGKKG